MHSELAVDAFQRTLDGVDAEEELGGGLFVGLACSDQLGDPPLALRQPAARRRAAANPRELGARVVGPNRRWQRLEDRERRLDRLPRRLSPLRAAKDRSVDEQSASALEWHRHPPVHLQRLLAAYERCFEAAFGGLEQAAAARAHGKRPGRPETAAGLFEPSEVDARLVEVADRDQRLDRELPRRVEARLQPTPCLAPADDGSQLLGRCRVVAGGQIDQT